VSDYQVIGKSIRRMDTIAKATGQALYSTDLSRPGMLYGKILYSDHAHARILNIDTHLAEAYPGVKAVITRDQAPSRYFGIFIRDRLIFATDVVRFIGEPVAAVAAISQAAAAKATRLIHVEYEDLPPLFNIEAALAPEAPILHPHLAEYEAIYPYIRYGNVCLDAQLNLGDVKQGFAEADHIIEAIYHTAPTHHAALEPHACLAEIDDNGRTVVSTGTQQISVLHCELATALDIPLTDIRVVPVCLGGGFGGRLSTHFEEICALLAQATRRPVKLVLSREEVFTTTPGRAPYTIRMRIGVRNDGKITAKDIDVLVDAGAYSDQTPGTATHAITVAQGPYHIPNCHARARVVYTNNPNWGCMRGYGAQEIAFATESLMDKVAHKLDMDPVDLRLTNLCVEGEPLLSTQKLRCVTIRETMEAALKASGYREKKGRLGPNRGIGVANLFHATGYLSSSASIRVNEDATITIITGVTEVGGGSQTVLRQIVAEVLGLAVESVRIATVDSDNAPYETGSIASRTVYDSGNAVRLAAEDVRKKMVNIAASTLKCMPEEIAVERGWIYQVALPDNRISFKDLVGIAIYVSGGPLLGSGSWLAAGPYPQPVGEGYGQGPMGTFLFGTHVAEVEVDAETGKTRILNYTACHDVGKAINPAGVEGQIEGGVVQGIGSGLLEEVCLKDGRIVNPSFVDYRLLTALDTPPITALYIEHPDSLGSFGAKGLGEPPIIPPAPAIANAIFDATGVQVNEIPITPERLYRALSLKKTPPDPSSQILEAAFKPGNK
jgi:CO/xanthine dehydrogenase Mo-binding subunit